MGILGGAGRPRGREQGHRAGRSWVRGVSAGDGRARRRRPAVAARWARAVRAARRGVDGYTAARRSRGVRIGGAGRWASSSACGWSWRGVDRRARRQGVAEHGAVRAARAAGEVDAGQPSQEGPPVAGRPCGDRRPRAGEEATGVGERGGHLARGE